MTIWHFYDEATGVIDPGFRYSGEMEHVMLNCPPGHAPIPDVEDPLAQRVDLEQGCLVDWQPPAPADDALQTWSWDEEARRWVSVPTVAGRKPALLAQLQQRMQAIEQGSQARPARELLLALLSGAAPDAAALARLQQSEAELQALRATYHAVEAAATHGALDLIEI